MASLDSMNRSVLPIPDRASATPVAYDAKDPAAKYPPIKPLRPPTGAPNVLVILLDDVGFGAPRAFGGPCHTPTAERLASQGLKYTRFHTTAICTPTRAALLSGRNHHSVGMGGITEMATAAPGYTSVRPNTCAPLAETLKLNGYATAQFGGATHAPHHAPREWADKYKGKFDHGWDRQRELTLSKQKELGVVPGDAQLQTVGDVGIATSGVCRHARSLQPHALPNRRDRAKRLTSTDKTSDWSDSYKKAGDSSLPVQRI